MKTKAIKRQTNGVELQNLRKNMQLIEKIRTLADKLDFEYYEQINKIIDNSEDKIYSDLCKYERLYLTECLIENN